MLRQLAVVVAELTAEDGDAVVAALRRSRARGTGRRRAHAQTIVSVATAAGTLLLIGNTWVDEDVMTDLLSEELAGRA